MMRGLWILAALSQALFTHTAATSVTYTCLQDQDTNATTEVLHFINELHHHGYKFRLVHVDSRTAQEKDGPCEVVMALTLEETQCHIVNPKPFMECELRPTEETKVTAKCNVTLCGGRDEPGIKKYTCDTESGIHATRNGRTEAGTSITSKNTHVIHYKVASREDLVKICPDCPSLLPLHDPKGLESVKAALEKFNSNHTTFFTLLEVGRITSQYNMMFGQTYFTEFAIVETECSTEKTGDKTACKPLCHQGARYGFCKSNQLGNGDLTVDCEIYDAQNKTHHRHPPFHSRHCGHHKGHHHHKRPDHHPGHDKRPDHHPGHDKRPDHIPGHDKRPDHHPGHGKRPDHHHGHDKRPDHASSPGHHGSARPDCFFRSDHPHHRGPAHRRGPPHHGDHHEHKSDPKKPTHQPLPHIEPTPQHPGSSDVTEFPFPQCHGFVKIPPSIYPICPFPPAFHDIRPHKE